MKLQLSEIAQAVNSKLIGEDREIPAVSIDTRTLQPGALYIAINGKNFDGHSFIDKAEQAGAEALLLERAAPSALPQIIVADTHLALAELAGYWRKTLPVKVAGVTGSNGKTTVKEMIAAIFATQGHTLSTQGNLNNDIGVPLTLLKLDDSHRYAVIEMGANHPGEIAYTSRYAQADVSVITNIGAAHIEGFGSIEGVAKTKGEIIESLGKDGVAVLNRDDAFYEFLLTLAGNRKHVSFGLSTTADVTALNIDTALDSQGFATCFELKTATGSLPIRLHLAGVHNVKNALAAATVAMQFGISPADIKQGLEQLQPVTGRMQPLLGSKGNIVIDDTYNANPSSLKAALDVLTDCSGEAWLALGAFGELGPDSPAIHREMGELIKAKSVQRLFATGALAKHAVEAFGDGGQFFDDQEQLIDTLTKAVTGKETLLVKGSRAQKMENVGGGDGQQFQSSLMLLFLADFLTSIDSGFRVLHYLTFRAILGVLTALSISLLVGPAMIEKLTRKKIGQSVRDDGPQSHFSKSGTPTMGGAMILFAVAISTLLCADLSNRYIWVVLLVTLTHGVIGFVDDYKKVLLGNSDGLSARAKYFWQSVVALGAALYLYNTAQVAAETQFIVPFFKNITLDIGWGYVVLTYFVIVGSSNAVNLTDGLDGLAIMPTVMIAAALAIFAYLSGHVNFSQYLAIPHIPKAGELVVFCAALVGSGLGFLWFNTYPAMVFMGDVGALALGAALGIVAVLVRQEIVLVIMGGIFVMETISVIIQVASFKTRKKRVFLMAPIHHHYELKGWPEPRIIVRFWIISVILVLIGLATLKLR